MPVALAERLGPDATKGLIDLLVTENESGSERVLTTCSERFERRLLEETTNCGSTSWD